MESLFRPLSGGRVHAKELSILLLEYFGHAAQVSDFEVSYGKSGQEECLRLVYDGAHSASLRDIQVGPSWNSSDLQGLQSQIDQHLLKSTGERVGRIILFSPRVLTGWWRHSTKLQLLPAPVEAPRPQFPAMGGNPLRLEFAFPSSSSPSIAGLRRSHQARNLTWLLNALILGPLHLPTDWAEHHWVFNPDRSSPRIPIYAREGYSFPGNSGEASEFTETQEIPWVAELELDQYYRWPPPSGAGDPITVPRTLSASLDRFFGLSQGGQEKFIRACYWFSFSSLVWRYSRSASYLALASAIEALSYHGQGSTEEFVQFLEVHAPGTGETERRRKQLYRLRAALSHGGRLMPTDLDPTLSAVTPEQIWDGEVHGEMQNIVGVALFNCLHGPHLED